jgi:hypothetical protein
MRFNHEAGRNDQSPIKINLHTSEWVLIGTLLYFIASIIIIANLNIYWAKSNSLALETHLPVEIMVTGAVKRPGAHKITPGEKLEALLRKAGLKREADLSALDLAQRIEASGALHVPERIEVSIQVSGEVVNPGLYSFPKGSRLQDIKTKLEFTDEADLTPLKSKKILKDGQNLVITKKEMSKQQAY